MTTLFVTEARSLAAKSQGLIGAPNIFPLLFRTRFGLHTFGIKHPIDVLILDVSSTVKELRRKLPPNYLYFWNPKFDRVIELPAGTIDEKGINVGDTIQVKITKTI